MINTNEHKPKTIYIYKTINNSHAIGYGKINDTIRFSQLVDSPQSIEKLPKIVANSLSFYETYGITPQDPKADTHNRSAPKKEYPIIENVISLEEINNYLNI